MSLLNRFRSAVHAFAAPAAKTMRIEPIAYPYERYSPHWLSEEFALATLDDLVSKKGLAVYREMMQREDQIAACVRLLQFSRLSTGYEITDAEDGAEGLDQEIGDFVRQVLGDLRESSVSAICLDAMDAFVAGFSIQEKLWAKPFDAGDFAGKQGYRGFRAIPQETIAIKRDAHGEIEPDGIWQSKEEQHFLASSTMPQSFTKLPRDRFVLWSWLTQFGNPYGISLLRPAYRWYMIKDLIVRAWAQHTERYGLPLMDLEVPDTTSNSEMDALEAKLRNFRTGGVLVRRSNHKLSITDVGSQSAPTFQPLLAECNRAMARAILTPATLFDQPETGAYSLGESQKSVWHAILENLGESLADRVMTEQIIRPLVEHNYGTGVSLPKFAFKPISPRDMAALVAAATQLADRGYPVPHAWVEKEAGIPAAQAGEPALGPSTATSPIDQMPDEVRDSGVDMDDLMQEVHEALADRSGNRLGSLFGVKAGSNGGGNGR